MPSEMAMDRMTPVAMPAEVAMTVTTAGTHDIAAGSMMDVGDGTFTCPAGGLGCSVEVMENADDGTITITSTGGMATAMPSQMAMDRMTPVVIACRGGHDGYYCGYT